MSRLPQPPTPATLRALLRDDEDVVTVSRATRFVRVFFAGGARPERWNEFSYIGPLPHRRFDPHVPTPTGGVATSPDHGVLYVQLAVRSAVAEEFQDTSTLDRGTRQPHLAIFQPTRSVRLLDLSGLWPTRAGASQEISSGPKRVTQAWARAIRAAHPDLDGVWYRSSMDSGEPAICLWDPPAKSVLPDAPQVLLPLTHPGLELPLTRVCEELNYTLLG
jgi:hypothetical protein